MGEVAESHDPYGSRWCGPGTPLILFQLDYDTAPSLYLPLDRRALQSYAEALRRCWSLLGLQKGDVAAIFDYGTSPLSYLASSAFTPYLKRGAAEGLGCWTVCNDGIASMSQRAVEILKFVRPRLLFVRADCLEPLAVEIETRLRRLSRFTEALVVSDNECLLSRADQQRFERRLGLPIYRLLRVDVAMFLATECPECHLLHSWEDLYGVETVEDDHRDPGNLYLVITNWFARCCPTVRYLSQIRASLAGRGCPRSPGDLRIAA
ncbi:MAG: hypothetical protein HY695_07250 [Deltaproteobacteria bacterium]|nr:hypothetical protein [Deltaproteobacteria bacterium]